MMRLKLFLKRYPKFYNFIKRWYYSVRFNFEENLLGTSVKKKMWYTKHIHEGDKWIEVYWDLRTHLHRKFLIKMISKLYPFSSILEIGCNAGPNLFLLAKKYPKTAIRGVDINPLAVRLGNKWLKEADIKNVELAVGEASSLRQFKDKSFDVVFTDAVLIYIGRDEIINVVKELMRVARKYIILVEWNYFDAGSKDSQGLGVHHLNLWKRDYAAMFKQFVPKKNIRIIKIPRAIWPDEGWKEYGAIIKVKLGDEK